MKYMQEGGFQRNPLMRLTLGLTLVFLAGVWATGALIYFAKMDLTPDSVVRYYRGSEVDFLPARSYGSMLEVAHFHLPMMGMVLLLLTHLLIFAPFRKRAKVFFITAAFLSALADEGAGWLVRFVSPSFAWLKVAGFLSLEATLLFLICGLGWFLASAPGGTHARGSSHRA